MQTSEVLNKAADQIQERGWKSGAGWVVTRGSEASPDDAPLCLEGGIMAALGMRITVPEGDDVTDEHFEPLWKCPAYLAVQRYIDTDDPRLYYWNDRPHRTADEVIAALRATAVIEAAREQEYAEVSV
jgi:hypothetical protein